MAWLDGLRPDPDVQQGARPHRGPPRPALGQGDRAAEPGLEGHDAPVRDGVEPEEHDAAERRAEGHQREECEALARARGHQLVEVFEEGASAAAVRPVFERRKLDARRHRFDVLIIWALDRFGAASPTTCSTWPPRRARAR